MSNLRDQKEALDRIANMDVEKARVVVPELMALYNQTQSAEHLQALARYKDERTKPVFIEALDYTDEEFDRAVIAAGVLGEMKATDAVDKLIAASEKPLPIKSRANAAKLAAIRALVKIGDKKAVAGADQAADHVGRRAGLHAQPEGGAGPGRAARSGGGAGPDQGPVHDRPGHRHLPASAGWGWCASASRPSIR